MEVFVASSHTTRPGKLTSSLEHNIMRQTITVALCALSTSLTLAISHDARAQVPGAEVIEQYGSTQGDDQRTTVVIETRKGIAVPVYVLERKKRFLRRGSKLSWNELCVAPCTITLPNGSYNVGILPRESDRSDLDVSVRAKGEPVFLRATPEISRRKNIGRGVLYSSAALIATSAIFWRYGLVNDNDSTTTASMIGFGAGLVGAAAGSIVIALAKPGIDKLRPTRRRLEALERAPASAGAP